MTESLTPMMRQYHEVKRKLPGKLIFFRLGDFYEMFFEDAVVAARELEITLTSRNKEKSGAPIPMCGVPHHAVEGYIARLIKKGYKVAICEQMEEPRPGKLVKREVVRIVTPGTVTEDVMLEPKDNNFLASILQRGDGFGAAFLDVSTGDFQATEFRGDELNERLIVELNHFQPSEILHPACNAPLFQEKLLGAILAQSVRSELDDWTYQADFAARTLLTVFGTSTLDGFGLGGRDLAVAAAGALLHYVQETNRESLAGVSALRFYESADFLKLDTESVANLELVRALDGGTKNTLLQVLDHTATHMGGRLLKNWILRPLMDLGQIRERQDGVAELAGGYLARERIRTCLRGVQDVERLLGKITSGTARPRDLLALKTSLAQFPAFRRQLEPLQAAVFRRFAAGFDTLDDLHGLLDRAVHEDPPPTLNEGGILKDGYSAELDELRALARGARASSPGWRSARTRADRHRLAQGRLQPGLRLLHRGHPRQPGPGAGRLHPQADAGQRRALHHRGAQGVRGEGPHRRGRAWSSWSGSSTRRSGCRSSARRPACRPPAGSSRPPTPSPPWPRPPSGTATGGRRSTTRPRLEITQGRHPVIEQPRGQLRAQRLPPRRRETTRSSS